MENKTTKISLTTAIVLFLIFVLIIGGVAYYIYSNNNKKENSSNYSVGTTTNENQKEVVENNSTTQVEKKLKMNKQEYPKVDGATAMKPMSVEIAKAVLDMTDEEAEEFIVHNTTAKAYENLINKNTDLIFVSEPSDDILNSAKEAGVEFEMTGIGRDGFVFVVNKENPVDSLTIEQIQKIYTGEITNWSEVGGNDEEIVAFQREQNSGSQNLMEQMVMKNLTMMDAPSGLMIASMTGLIDSVSQDFDNGEASIGYSIYLYAKEQYVKDNIKFLAINGVYPTDDTIADGSYPLSKIVYAINRKDEENDSNVRRLVNWLLTNEGQEVVEAGGYTKIK